MIRMFREQEILPQLVEICKLHFKWIKFDIFDINGLNLNEPQLFNCKWKNIKIHELNKLEGHSYAVFSVNFSPDGTKLASNSQEYYLSVYVMLIQGVLNEQQISLIYHEKQKKNSKLQNFFCSFWASPK
ncbi:unnamed protein product (macronuclear) [Paramecium tetraurelia]|uniref:Uncharacterized protein n=1 Tax=Paramecium tetraurelia TaxID=5888 RepID=A0DKT9_PARTE|nr:uncharacterized protein GSPATT00039555001 [Paramecium tetraurelia]CAK83656.1 unnamed protein product [Paramecium tetraurelia]|eukprot:XP_001451053.1 hypothetical protein (macronuclear) [Paramecium tetraurelia strain d4-2]